MIAQALLVAVLSMSAWTAPPVHTRFDYQLGGDDSVPAEVGIVARDRTSAPVPGRYSICYVNAFQTQPNETKFWKRHADLILRDADAHVVVDEAWGEQLLDIRTAATRRALGAIVGRWIVGCARSGFQGVEFDNLDSFTRSDGLISRSAAQKFAGQLVRRAHRAGLAAGQKNFAEWNGSQVGFDFAVAEQCGQYDECGRYVASYGEHVLAIEYTDASFESACTEWGSQISVLRRDQELQPGGLRSWC